MNWRSWLAVLSGVAFPGCASGPGPGDHDIRTETLHYDAGGARCTGHLFYDARRLGPRPGVLVVHEWWGLNDYVLRRARMLAEAGYVALALDMYGDGKQAAHPADAQKFAAEVFANLAAAKARFTAAKDLLQHHPYTDRERIGAIGYCFGGAIVLGMARAGMDLDAVASFHGNLATEQPAAKGQVKARILVCHGGDDEFIPQTQIDAFQQEMAAAGADLTFVAYPGAKHGFTSKEASDNGRKFGLPLAYDAKADVDSWRLLLDFLAETWK
ncbi:MAG: dienelactone hydrolase family protein [Planctomycetes bacterium]|nr:dienelactone hydrolase family protein [Planctomycetota bacterium]